MLGRLCGLTDIGCARDVFLGSSLEAFAHKMGGLDTEVCCTQKIYVRSGEKGGAGSRCGRQRKGQLDESCALPRGSDHLSCSPMVINFRKIDVDAYDEDVLLETELYDPDPRGPQQVIEDAKAKAASVRSSLAK